MTITVIRTSDRGAHLISDGVHVCWVQGRWLRQDNTLTNRGLQAMEAATDTLEAYQERLANKEKAREEFRVAQKADVRVFLNEEQLAGETEKAYKVWNGGFSRMYGKMVKYYEYIPKSQVRGMERIEGRIVLTVPKWLKDQTGWLKEYDDQDIEKDL